ncbi:MAG: hypothetical protein Q8N45_09180, partial [Anaerolineales bacterium]|nr:hypothetical protein [Anaerolineales bacterium]
NAEIVPSSSNGQTLTRSIQYRDTGVILHVTPRIGSDGLISLDVDQQVSNATENVLSGISSPVISTRQLKALQQNLWVPVRADGRVDRLKSFPDGG